LYYSVQYAEVDVTRDPDVSVQHSRRLCYTLFERCLDIVHQWAGAVPRFNELSVRDQQLLFRASLLEVFTLRLADRYALTEKLLFMPPQEALCIRVGSTENAEREIGGRSKSCGMKMQEVQMEDN